MTVQSNNIAATSTKQHLKTILGEYLAPRWPRLVFAIVLMAVSSAMTGALAKLMEPIIDEVFSKRNEQLLVLVAGATLGAFTIRGLADYGHTVLMSRIGFDIVADIQGRLYDHILDHDLSFFYRHKSGELMSRILSDVGVMRYAVAEGLTSIIKSSLTLVILLGVMWTQDWQLTLIALAILPPAAIGVAKLGKKLRQVSTTTQVETGELTSHLTQSIQGIRHIKAYNAEDFERTTGQSLIRKLFSLSYKAARVSALSRPISEVLSGIAIMIIIFYGGGQVISGENTAGAFFSFMTAFFLAYNPAKRLAKLNNNLQTGLGAADRILALFDEMPDVNDPDNPTKLTATNPDIRIDDVTFIYGDGTKALDNISIRIPPNKKVALVGPSGGGKSTCLNLIPRFYDPDRGEITINGTDIRRVALDDLRRHIALVSQHVTIFNDRLAANIAYGEQDNEIDMDRVRKAADMADARDFIADLPAGFDTIVGERGMTLSGGQRQRVAIARAIYKDAPILLLDEATSSLDTASEKAIQDALKRLQQGRTSLVIAHRLSTIVDADHIYVIKDGQVMEEGDHDHLMASGGLYADLYDRDRRAGSDDNGAQPDQAGKTEVS